MSRVYCILALCSEKLKYRGNDHACLYSSLLSVWVSLWSSGLSPALFPVRSSHTQSHKALNQTPRVHLLPGRPGSPAQRAWPRVRRGQRPPRRTETPARGVLLAVRGSTYYKTPYSQWWFSLSRRTPVTAAFLSLSILSGRHEGGAHI